MAELDLSQVDINRVHQLLTLHAYRLMGVVPGEDGGRVVEGTGVSPEDLATQTLLLFLDPDKHLWKLSHGQPTTAAVVSLLRTVMRNDLLDLKASKAHTTTLAIDRITNEDGEAMTLDDFASRLEGPDGAAMRAQDRQRLIACVKGDKELEDLLDVLLNPQDYGVDKNQEIATLFPGKKATDIVNLRRRLDTAVRRNWPRVEEGRHA